MPESQVVLTPLGGLGEIGMNCMALETEQSMILVDCGLMFPDVILYGVDVVIPRMDFIVSRKHKLKGILLTHGHEDHIGALAWLVPYLQQVPLFLLHKLYKLLQLPLITAYNFYGSTLPFPYLLVAEVQVLPIYG